MDEDAFWDLDFKDEEEEPNSGSTRSNVNGAGVVEESLEVPAFLAFFGDFAGLDDSGSGAGTPPLAFSFLACAAFILCALLLLSVSSSLL